MTTDMGLDVSDLMINCNKFLVQTSKIYGCLQKIALVSLQRLIVHAEHHSQVAAHIGEISMFDTMQRDYYWPHMANEVHERVGNL